MAEAAYVAVAISKAAHLGNVGDMSIASVGVAKILARNACRDSGGSSAWQ